MKITIDTEIIWGMVRYYNNLSHEYSEIADKLTKIVQEVEDQNE